MDTHMTYQNFEDHQEQSRFLDSIFTPSITWTCIYKTSPFDLMWSYFYVRRELWGPASIELRVLNKESQFKTDRRVFGCVREMATGSHHRQMD